MGAGRDESLQAPAPADPAAHPSQAPGPRNFDQGAPGRGPRSDAGAGKGPGPDAARAKADSPDSLKAIEDELIQKRRRLIGVPTDGPTVGLALSGGGIRSATFCLGLLRGLAQNGLLTRFD